MKNTSKKTMTKVATAANTTITFDDAITAVVNTILTNPTNSAALSDAIRTATSAYDTSANPADACTILNIVTDKVHEKLNSALKTDVAINMAKAVIGLVIKDLRTSYETAVDDLHAIFAHKSGFAGTYVANAIILSAFTVEEVKADTTERISAAKATLAEKAAGLANAKASVKDAAKLAEIETTAKAEIKDIERQVKRLEEDLKRLAAFGDPKAIAKIGLMVNQNGKRGAFLVDRDTDTAASTPTRLPRWATGEEKPIWVPLDPNCGIAKGTKRGDMLSSLIKIEIKEAGKKARFLGFVASK